jgi:hypothetical protein
LRYYGYVKAHQSGWDHFMTRSVSGPACQNVVIEQIRWIGHSQTMLAEVGPFPPTTL